MRQELAVQRDIVQEEVHVLFADLGKRVKELLNGLSGGLTGKKCLLSVDTLRKKLTC